MRRVLPILAIWLAWVPLAQAKGLLIPNEKTLPPLAMVNHRVKITIEDQVAVTRVEQTFRNHTDRQLEATYIFPVPKGASVNKFTMWVDGKEVSGEMIEAAKARQIYTDIVRRTQDPGLLEYMDNNLLRLRVFPVPPKKDQKVTLSYTSVAPRDGSVIEYIYPLKTDGKTTQTLEDFGIQATIKSQHPIQNVFSPTHALNIKRPNDREVTIDFERNQGLLDKDFQLFYAIGDKDVGFTLLTHRPISSDKGFFMLLLSPRVETSKSHIQPRDMVFVVDTSGSMRGPKLDQAKRAVKYCVSNLGSDDRFAVLNFATTINRYRDQLTEATATQLDEAKRWVDRLESTGGTAINDALAAALDLRSSDTSRTFTIVFFTDGMPTIGETKPENILRNVAGRNSGNTRIFTFGVGDDVNASMLDQLAEQSRAVSTYVRPAEDIEAKVSGLYSKISNPVLANLKLTCGPSVQLDEIYPPQLPDLFHGGQIVVFGRYNGQSHAAVTLNGSVGKETRDFTFEIDFPARTGEERSFVENLWARRKVGYLLDQIRANGEKKELIDETVVLAKKYGIATPYTSYLIVPDAPVPVAGGAHPDSQVRFMFGGRPGGMPGGGAGGPGGATFGNGRLSGGYEPGVKVQELADRLAEKPGKVAGGRGGVEAERLNKLIEEAKPTDAKRRADAALPVLEATKEKLDNLDKARGLLRAKDQYQVQTGKLGVDLSVDNNNLRNQSRLSLSCQQTVAGRNCVEVSGVWIDDAYEAKMSCVVVKAQSDAYFRMLERQPKLKDVFKLGNFLVWVTPSNTALVIDLNDGKDKLSDEEIDRLFVVARK